jgi:hypothetical protein
VERCKFSVKNFNGKLAVLMHPLDPASEFRFFRALPTPRKAKSTIISITLSMFALFIILEQGKHKAQVINKRKRLSRIRRKHFFSTLSA